MGNSVKLEVLTGQELIDRRHVSDVSPQRFVRDYFLPNRPLIIEGATAGWTAASWTLDNLSQYLPDQKVSVRNNQSGVLFDANTMAFEATDMPLHQYLHLYNVRRIKY